MKSIAQNLFNILVTKNTLVVYDSESDIFAMSHGRRQCFVFSFQKEKHYVTVVQWMVSESTHTNNQDEEFEGIQ